jgi:FolB domain-containing protein
MLTGEWLCLDGIAFTCVIGVTERERRTRQDIVVNLSVKVDFGKVASSDAIHDTVDYRALTRRVLTAGENSSFQLIETLASYLCRTILDDFPIVQAVRVEVEKPHALSAAKSVRAVILSQRAAP